jgi:DNA-nicking Smr family endonuclease
MAKQRTIGRKDPSPAAGAAIDQDRATDQDIDDALAFRVAVRDVKPLVQKPLPVGLVKAGSGARRRKPARTPHDLDVDMPLIDSVPLTEADELPTGESMAGGDTLTFQRAGVRAQVVRRLRRGLFPIEDELDLHGLSQTAARHQLAEFLAFNRNAGRRCVRIIHGKGYRSGARGPVLKIAVNLWLRRHLDVMAFTSARAIDGGTGAVYVLLRA